MLYPIVKIIIIIIKHSCDTLQSITITIIKIFLKHRLKI